MFERICHGINHRVAAGAARGVVLFEALPRRSGGVDVGRSDVNHELVGRAWVDAQHLSQKASPALYRRRRNGVCIHRQARGLIEQAATWYRAQVDEPWLRLGW